MVEDPGPSKSSCLLGLLVSWSFLVCPVVRTMSDARSISSSNRPEHQRGLLHVYAIPPPPPPRHRRRQPRSIGH